MRIGKYRDANKIAIAKPKLNMPDHTVKIIAVTQLFEGHTHFAETLFHPEFSCLGDSPVRLQRKLLKYAVRATRAAPPLDFHRRRAAGDPVVSEIKVELSPVKRFRAWLEPVSLRFHVLTWSHGNHAAVAYVPALGIEIIAESAGALERRIPEHIRWALARSGAAASLAGLARFDRVRSVQLDTLTASVSVPAPKQIAKRSEQEVAPEPVLKEVGVDLCKQGMDAAYEVDELVSQVADALVGRNPKSVLLVGPPGVGKTAVVHELVRSRRSLQLGHTPFWGTSGARLIAGMTGFGSWQARCQRLCREVSKERAILYLDSLVELIEVGRGGPFAEGIAAFLQPFLSRGEVLAIAECTLEQLHVVEQQMPGLVDVFHQIRVDPPPEARLRVILSKRASAAGSSRGVSVDEAGLATLDSLHRRYATHSTFPGRPLRFLLNLIQEREKPGAISSSDITAAFSRETGLPLFMLDDAIPLDLQKTHAWFRERLMGQAEAVDRVVNLLAALKTRLTRPGRPLASLLFIGPTGVGKTEMAKCLAEFLFGDRQRMTRFDMSEYSDPGAVSRLIGALGAEGQLTAKVREQPFSVILFDEFEKADPSFFDLLLQVLGDGRLTDAAGRVAGFTSSVVIMTSNLGAASFQQGPFGFAGAGQEEPSAGRHFIEAVRDFLRPELFNRIDRIISFAPLDQETCVRIARRELDLIWQRDAVRFRGLTVRMTDDVALYLARKGYDPSYGARPLKRAIARLLLVPLADRLNDYSEEAALEAEVRVAEEGGIGEDSRIGDSESPAEKLQITVRRRMDAQGRSISNIRAAPWVAGLAQKLADLRREAQKLETCSAKMELENEATVLRRRNQQREHRRSAGSDLRCSTRLRALEALLAEVERVIQRIRDLEHEFLLSMYERRPLEVVPANAGLAEAKGDFNKVMLEIHGIRFDNGDTITLEIQGEDLDQALLLAQAYFRAANAAQYRVAVHYWVLKKHDAGLKPAPEEPDEAPVRLKLAENVREFFAQPPPGVLCIVLHINGHLAYPRFELEGGRHVFKMNRRESACLVRIHQTSPAKLQAKPPEGIERRTALRTEDGGDRRIYDMDAGIVHDVILLVPETRPFSRQGFDETLRQLIDETHQWSASAELMV